MKRFITVSPYQSETALGRGIYAAADNQKLACDIPTRFPIITAINAYAEPGEEIEIITVIADYPNAKQNYVRFQEEIGELSGKKGFKYTLKEISVPYNNAISTELELLGKLIDSVSDGDTLYTCITYGSKPFPLVQVMALNYAYRIRKDVSIGCIVYGAKDHNNGEMTVYDITSLFYIDEAIRLMAEQKVTNPTEIIRMLLK